LTCNNRNSINYYFGKNLKNENRISENTFKEPNPIYLNNMNLCQNLNNSNMNDSSTMISENMNLITKNNHYKNIENNNSMNKDEFFALLESNKEEFEKNLNINIEDDKNIKNLKDNSIHSLNSDLNILHSYLFLYTKFENSRPYKMIEYIMTNNDSNISNFIGSNHAYNNEFSNCQNMSKNFLSSKIDKEFYEEIKKTIFNKPRCHLNEPRAAIQKTLFQYIKSDFSNSNIIKIFDKCNSKIEKRFKFDSSNNLILKDKFTYQNILIEKLKDNYNNDLLLEINDTDMLKSMIYIVNKNNKLGFKFKKVNNNILNNNNKIKENTQINNNNFENLSISESNINQISNSTNNSSNINNYQNNSYLFKTLSNNYNFINNAFEDFKNSFLSNQKSNQMNIKHTNTEKVEIKSFDKKHNHFESNIENSIKYCKSKNFDLMKRIKKTLFYEKPSKSININSQSQDYESTLNNQEPIIKEQHNSYKKSINNSNSHESRRLKRFIYRKMKFLINDDDKKTIALLKSLKNKDQNIKLFCKLLELFSKCREDDFEKIFKKMKDYLSGIDLELVDNLEAILNSLNLQEVKNDILINPKSAVKEEDFISKKNIENHSDKNVLYLNMQQIILDNEKDKEKINENSSNENKNAINEENIKFEKNDIKEDNINNESNFFKKNSKIKKSNSKNNLIKLLLNLKSFWVNFRLLFSILNIIENSSENKLEYLTDEKFWRIIFNYIMNKDYKIGKNKTKKMKIGTEQLNNVLLIPDNSEYKESKLSNSGKKELKKNRNNIFENEFPCSERIEETNKNEDSKFKPIQKRKYNRIKTEKGKENNQFLNNLSINDFNETDAGLNKINLSINPVSNDDAKNECFFNAYNINRNKKVMEFTESNSINIDKSKKLEEKLRKKEERMLRKLEKENRKKLREEKKKNLEIKKLKNLGIEITENQDIQNKTDQFGNVDNLKALKDDDIRNKYLQVSLETKDKKIFDIPAILLDDESKNKILERINDKIPLFDIFKRDGKLSNKSFTHFRRNLLVSNQKNPRKLNKDKNNQNYSKEKAKRRKRGKYNKKPKETEKDVKNKKISEKNDKKINKKNSASKTSGMNYSSISNNSNSKANINKISNYPNNEINIFNNNVQNVNENCELDYAMNENSDMKSINPFNILVNNISSTNFMKNNNIKQPDSQENEQNTLSELSEIQTNSNLKLTKKQQKIKIKGNVIINNYFNIYHHSTITDPTQIINSLNGNTNNLNILQNSEKELSNNCNTFNNYILPKTLTKTRKKKNNSLDENMNIYNSNCKFKEFSPKITNEDIEIEAEDTNIFHPREDSISTKVEKRNTRRGIGNSEEKVELKIKTRTKKKKEE